MVSIKLDTIKQAVDLVDLCKRYDEDIDVIWQRYTIDGKSILGVTSLMGNIVTVEMISNDNALKDKFNNEVLKLQEEFNDCRTNEC